MKTKDKLKLIEEMKEYNDRLYKGDGNFLTRVFLDVFEQHVIQQEKGNKDSDG